MPTELDREAAHLAQIIAVAARQCAEAKARNAANGAAILELKHEFREETSHAVYNLYAAPNFHDLVNMAQAAQPLMEKVNAFDSEERKIFVLERVLAAPYFARIDFRFDDDGAAAAPEPIYIGRAALRDDSTHDIYIYDWRSPVAGVYYRFGVGRAFYDAPAGRINGDVTLKRQYEIKGGILEYFFDADVQVYDDYFRRLLSQNATPQMKTIIETIQRDQDIIIRDQENDLLMVQGAAGSGKTSVALHRVAWLLYRGMAEGLTAQNILVLAPSSLFEEYIAQVLPELGEANVVTAVYEEILTNILGSVLPDTAVQTRYQELEEILAAADPLHREQTRRDLLYKTSAAWTGQLKQFLRTLPESYFEPLPPDKQKPGGPPLCLKVYRKFLNRLAAEPEAKQPPGLRVWTRNLQNTKTLRYEDALTLAYLEVRLSGCATFYNIRQVVIDEAQDYGALHFELLRLLFPAARYTVLGDIAQALETHTDLTRYDEISKALARKKSSRLTLEQSFRSTREILAFSAKFRDDGADAQPFNRHGDEPAVCAATDQEELRLLVTREVEACRAGGYATIGLLTKTAGEAEDWQALLLPELPELRLFTGAAGSRIAAERNGVAGVSVLPLYLAKGLEFDAVLLLDVDKEHYADLDDRRLLYIGCTRALHRLRLFYSGEKSELL